jgi:hypothetical protein
MVDMSNTFPDDPPSPALKPGIVSALECKYIDSSPGGQPVDASIPVYIKRGVMCAEDYGYGDTGPSVRSQHKVEMMPRITGKVSRHHSRRFSMPTELPASLTTTDLCDLVSKRVPSHEGEGSSRSQRRSSMPTAVSTMISGICGMMPGRSSLRQEGAPRRNSITDKGEREVVLPPTKKGEGFRRVKRRTSLTFNQNVNVTTIEPIHNLAKKKDLWFQDDEIKGIQDKVRALVHETEICPGGPRRDSVRGLERLMDPESTYVKRDVAYAAVFNEQYLQSKEGIVEEDYMARLYKFSTMRSRKDAEIRAKEDSQEVSQYLESTRRRWRRSSM